jgi:hypothetical protein
MGKGCWVVNGRVGQRGHSPRGLGSYDKHRKHRFSQQANRLVLSHTKHAAKYGYWLPPRRGWKEAG